MTTPLTNYDLPAWETLPAMPIYMDQLLALVNQQLTALALPLVTKTMVNSYVKQHFFSRPTGRRYTRNHVVAVLIVSLLKTDFKLETISRAILAIRESREIEVRYQQFRLALAATLAQRAVPRATDQLGQAIQFAAQTVGAHLLTTRALS
ncbi:DUF1836 domain-containing protein [Lactiplantibacillus modestisalitolerans]|uniref:DUF1836 domain-containing protein n=1 Tax=Lactiplantibacillus modestisalitolerans TaxID=1457219 RepID=A0ABV5WS30_9LACO|nr:DUF1836 domain-containing protein [Lactiplantibacillus modestisalitolerans]